MAETVEHCAFGGAFCDMMMVPLTRLLRVRQMGRLQGHLGLGRNRYNRATVFLYRELPLTGYASYHY
jgi:hypothetical protein